MQVIPFNRAALMLAATLVTGSGLAAEQVERDEAAAPAPAPVPPKPLISEIPPAPPAREATRSHSRTQSERERDERLEEAKRRLEQAAAEVASLSSEIAQQAMQSFSSAFMGGPPRSIIGVRLEAVSAGTGAKVLDVSPGGPAEASGVRAGDVIVAVNGVAVKGTAMDVARILREVPPDTVVRVKVMRDGKPKDMSITARAFDPGKYAFTAPDFNFNYDFDIDPSQIPGFPGGGPGAMRGGLAGMEVTELTPQLARYFGTDKGLLVVRAPKNDVYKLQDGDVILTIDGRVPTNGSHVTRILRSYQGGERLTIHVMRDRKALDLEVTLPDQSRNRRVRATRADGEATTL